MFGNGTNERGLAVANIMMNPALVIQGTSASRAGAADKLVASGPQGSFSDHLERKMAAAKREAGNKLGGAPSAEHTGAQAVKSARPRAEKKAEAPSDEASVVELLQQVMHDLQAQAKDIKQGPGEWTFSPVETPALSQLAMKAGMNQTEISWLLQQANEQGGKVTLADFLASLDQYFSRLAQAEPVTVPETDLPLIETFLSKMGLSVEESNRIAKAAVPGGENLDLGLLLQALQQTPPATVEGLTAIPLTPWEGEQLQLMLAKAGLPRSYQESLLATASLNLARAGRSATSAEGALLQAAQNGPSELSFSSLSAMLDSRLQELKGSRTVEDLPGFLGQFKEVLTQAGFTDKTVGWAPVVQNSVQSIYDELQQLVEATKAKIDRGFATAAAVGEERLTDQLQALKVKQAMAGQQGAANPNQPTLPPGTVAQELQKRVGSQSEPGKAGAASGSDQPMFAAKSEIVPPNTGSKAGGKSSGEGSQPGWGEQLLQASEEKGQASSADFAQSGHPAGDEGKGIPASAMAVGVTPPLVADGGGQTQNVQSVVRQVSEFDRQVMNQISEGVARGLKNNDHHLLLTLNPKDLGEVKVDMKVRDHQVEVSFVMENSKVKAALESQLSDFKDNLQKQGYSLGEYSVTVNQDNGGHDARQRFEFAWQEQMRGSKSRIPVSGEDGPYWFARPEATPTGPGNINLVI